MTKTIRNQKPRSSRTAFTSRRQNDAQHDGRSPQSKRRSPRPPARSARLRRRRRSARPRPSTHARARRTPSRRARDRLARAPRRGGRPRRARRAVDPRAAPDRGGRGIRGGPDGGRRVVDEAVGRVVGRVDGAHHAGLAVARLAAVVVDGLRLGDLDDELDGLWARGCRGRMLASGQGEGEGEGEGEGKDQCEHVNVVSGMTTARQSGGKEEQGAQGNTV
jgi:hypothetical protein